MERNVVERIRAICMAFPEAAEKPFGGHVSPSFRVGDKIFATINEAQTEITCKAPPGAQAVLVGSNSERFFVPKYVGHQGWIGLRLDSQIDWDELAGLLAESYAMTAPKALLARMMPAPAPGE
ncbi:MAG: MmcQ/YjbR family DNA-binding protein [Tepidiformaceae bacterium]